MNSRKFIYQLLLTFVTLVFVQTGAFSVEDNTSVALSEIKPKSSNALSTQQKYIKNIEVMGTNTISPNSILNQLEMKRGDVYDRNLLQTDLLKIYQMGFFTDKMKAIPVENPDNTITIKIVVEEKSRLIFLIIPKHLSTISFICSPTTFLNKLLIDE